MKIRLDSKTVTVVFGASGSSAGGGPLNTPPPDPPAPNTPIALEAPARSGHYEINTAGLTDMEIVQEINRLQLYHAEKSARLDGFAVMIGTAFTAGAFSYTVAHLGLWERGTDVELYASAVGLDGKRPKPVKRTYSSVSAVPRDHEIVQMLRESIADEVAAAAREAELADRLRALLG